jgi:rubrerythrin
LVESHTVEVEEIHADLYQKALDSLDNPVAVECYYVCSVYGYTCENETPETCPVYSANIKAFSKAEKK